MRSGVENCKKIYSDLLWFNCSVSDSQADPVQHVITVSLNQKLRTRGRHLGEKGAHFRLTTGMEVSFRAVDNDRTVRGPQQSSNEQRECVGNAVADIRGSAIFTGFARPEFKPHQIGSWDRQSVDFRARKDFARPRVQLSAESSRLSG